MLFDDTYRTIEKASEGIFKDKGSKFIALAIPANTEKIVKEKIEELKKQYHDARHHCYAYVLGPDKSAYRHNDDGEPSGTAGRPIYGQIQSFDLTNILIVVVRYFGGTKLGVSGLINAYKTATKEALNAATIKELTVKDVYSIRFEYPLMNDVMRVVKEDKLDVVKQDFQMSCEIIFRIRKKESNKVYDRFNKIHGVKISYLKTF
jgi:uncharacterized YigZ family protein